MKQDNLMYVQRSDAVWPGSARRAGFIFWFAVIATLAWMASVWLHRFIPLSDYPVWIHEGQIFSQILTHRAVACYGLVHWPVPNSAFVFTIGLLDLVFGPETSGKIFLDLVILLYALGSYGLVGSMTARRDSPLFLLPFLYVFHHSVWLGELSFSFGLDIFLLAVAFLLKFRPAKSAGHSWVVAVMSVLIFFSHGIAFVCWIGFLVLYAALDPSRQPRLKTLAAVSPSLVLLGLYEALHAHAGHVKTAHAGHVNFAWKEIFPIVHAPSFFCSVFAPLHFFTPFYLADPGWFRRLCILFNLCCIFAVIALAAVWLVVVLVRLPANRSQDCAPRAVIVSPVAYFAVFLIAPFGAVTGIIDFNYRFLLPGFLLMLAALAANARQLLSEKAKWMFTALAASAVTAVLVFQYAYVGSISNQLQSIYTALAQSHPSPDFRVVESSPTDPDMPEPLPPHGGFLPARRPLVYLPEYLRTEYDVPGPVLTTSIIDSSFHQDNFQDSLKSGVNLPGTLVIPGLRANNHKIAATTLTYYDIVSDTPYLLVLERKLHAGAGARAFPGLRSETRGTLYF